jgi:hypothetical protein
VNADGGIGRCEPKQVQREQLPDNPAPMMAIRLTASSFSPRFVVLSVVVLKAQAVSRRQRRPVLADLSLLAAKTYARDALEPLPSFSAFFRAETLFQAL